MANLTRKQRESQEQIKRAIMDGYQRGVCDSEGRSVKNAHGKPVKKPRRLHVIRQGSEHESTPEEVVRRVRQGPFL